LLGIVTQQFDALIREGMPDIEEFFASLQAEDLVSEEECLQLKIRFAPETVSPLTYREITA
jgi:hypothetical protein